MGPLHIAAFGIVMGGPELKVTPVPGNAHPKYQLLNSPWENPKKGIDKIRPIMILAFKVFEMKKRKREEVASSRYGLDHANVMIYFNIR